MIQESERPIATLAAFATWNTDSPYKDHEMRKGFTRKPQPDEPATRAKNYITESGIRAEKTFFGATVRYANAAAMERVVSIVGADEVDLKCNHISWMSPLARSLMKSEAGDGVVLHALGGTESLTVLDVCYQHIPVETFREPPGAESSGKGPRHRR